MGLLTGLVSRPFWSISGFGRGIGLQRGGPDRKGGLLPWYASEAFFAGGGGRGWCGREAGG